MKTTIKIKRTKEETKITMIENLKQCLRETHKIII